MGRENRKEKLDPSPQPGCPKAVVVDDDDDDPSSEDCMVCFPGHNLWNWFGVSEVAFVLSAW